MESSSFALDVHAHAIVVPVRILALAPVAAQGVPGGKCLFYADLKHSLCLLIGRPASTRSSR